MADGFRRVPHFWPTIVAVVGLDRASVGQAFCRRNFAPPHPDRPRYRIPPVQPDN